MEVSWQRAPWNLCPLLDSGERIASSSMQSIKIYGCMLNLNAMAAVRRIYGDLHYDLFILSDHVRRTRKLDLRKCSNLKALSTLTLNRSQREIPTFLFTLKLFAGKISHKNKDYFSYILYIRYIRYWREKET